MVHTGYPSFGPRSGAASARHSLSSLCRRGSSDPLFSFSVPTVCRPACRVYSELRRDPRRERSEGSVFLRSSHSIPLSRVSRGHSSLATIPFTIMFFARPNPLTPIESYSYKKQGRGWVSRRTPPTQAVPSFSTAAKCVTRRKRRKPISFMPLLHDLRTPPGGGPRLFRLRGSPHSASLRYPFSLFASPLCLNAGGPIEP